MRRLLLSMALVSCAAPKAQITADLIERLPTEGRVAIYDRENDIVIARIRRDEALAAIASTKTNLKKLDERLSRAEERLKKAGQQERISPAKQMLRAKQDFIEAQLGIAEAQLDFANSEVGLAEARLEQARQQQLVRFGLAPGSDMAAFDAATEKLEKRLRDAERKEADLRAAAQKVFETWKSAEDTYSRTTGDFDALVWLD